MLYYITSNEGKMRVANKYLTPFGIEVSQKTLDLIEIQSDSIEEITEHKAEQAFNLLQQPLIVNDAGWYFSALNGFPGPYMRYVQEWLKPQDFLNLMKDKANRDVTYIECFCYKDKNVSKLFKQETVGTFLESPQGKGLASWTLISLREDGKLIAQAWEEGVDPITNYAVWQEFATWYKHLTSNI